MSDQKVNIIISAKNEASAAIKQVHQELNGIGTGAKAGLSGITQAATAPAGALGNLKGAFAGVGTAATSLQTPISTLAGSLSSIGGVSGIASSGISGMATSIGLIANPATAALAAITALVGGFIKLGQAKVESEHAWAETGEKIKAFGGAEEGLKEVKSLITSLAFVSGKTKGEIRDLFDMLLNKTGDLNKSMGSLKLAMGLVSGGLFRGTRQAAMALADALNDDSKALESASPHLKEFADNLESEANAAGKSLSAHERAIAVLKEAEKSYSSFIGNLQDVKVKEEQLSLVWDELKKSMGNTEFIGGIVSAFTGMVVSIKGAFDGIKSAWGGMIGAINSMMPTLPPWLQEGAKGAAELVAKYGPKAAAMTGGLYPLLKQKGDEYTAKRLEKEFKNIEEKTRAAQAATGGAATGPYDLDRARRELDAKKADWEYANKRAYPKEKELADWKEQERIVSKLYKTKVDGTQLAVFQQVRDVRKEISNLEISDNKEKTKGNDIGQKSISQLVEAKRIQQETASGQKMSNQQLIGLYEQQLKSTKATPENASDRLSAQDKINQMKFSEQKAGEKITVDMKSQRELAGMTVEQLKNAVAENQKQLGLMEKAKAVAGDINKVRAQGVQIQQALGNAMKKQADQENAIEDARQAGYKEAHEKEMAQNAEAIDNLAKGYQDTISSAQEGYLKEHDNAAKLSEENRKLTKDKAAAQTKEREMAGMALLTDEQRVLAWKKISNLMGSTAEETDKMRRAASEDYDNQTEMFLAWNNIQGIQAEIHKDKMAMHKIDSGLVSNAKELAGIYNDHHALAKRIKEETGLTLENITNMTEEEYEAARAAKEFADNISTANANLRTATKFGMVDDIKSAISELESAYKKLFVESKGTNFGAYSQYQYYKGQGKALDDKEQAEQDAKDRIKQEADETHDMLSSAIETGMNEGAARGIKGFMDQLKNNFQKRFADMIATGLMQGGEKGGPGFFGALMSNSTPGMTANAGSAAIGAIGAGGSYKSAADVAVKYANERGRQGRKDSKYPMEVLGYTNIVPGAQASGMAAAGVMQKGNTFAQGWGNMVYAATKGKQGAIGEIAEKGGGFMSQLKGLFGGGAAGGGGGFMGLLGKASPWLMAASMVAGFLKKPPAPAQSGVAQLPQQTGIQNVGGGLDILRGSAEFNRMSFSARNMSGALTGRMAGIRMAGESEKMSLEVSIKESPLFHTALKSMTGESIKMSNAGGTPRRTGNEIG